MKEQTKFKAGDSITVQPGVDARVERFIGCGGFGEVYAVNTAKGRYALKWFSSAELYDDVRRSCYFSKKYYDLPVNVTWPLVLSEKREDGFGYLMELLDDKYRPLTDLFTGKLHMSASSLTEAAINLTHSLRIIHSVGCFCTDLHDGNIFIDPDSGSIKLIDSEHITDDVPEYARRFHRSDRVSLIESALLSDTTLGFSASDGEHLPRSIRFMAPEYVNGSSESGLLNDRYSLAVILFMMLCRVHPFERLKKPGRAIPVLSDIYSCDTVFIFDEGDSSNAPDPEKDSTIIERWEMLPEYIKKLFRRAFSQAAMKTPARRPADVDWLSALGRMQAEALFCSRCGRCFIPESYDAEYKCPYCGKRRDAQFCLKLYDTFFVPEKGRILRRLHAGLKSYKNCLDPIAEIVAKDHDQTILGLKNLSPDSWTVSVGCEQKEIPPGKIIRLTAGMVCDLGSDCRVETAERKIEPAADDGDTHAAQPEVPDETFAAVPRITIPVFIAVDSSKHDDHERIGVINKTLKDIVESLSRINWSQSGAEFRLAVMEYGSYPDHIRWITGDSMVNPDDLDPDVCFDWKYCDDKLIDLPGALREISGKLKRRGGFLDFEGSWLKPVIFFFTDFEGLTDPTEADLEFIGNNRLLKSAVTLFFTTEKNAVPPEAFRAEPYRLVNSESIISCSSQDAFGLLLSIFKNHTIVYS